MNKYFIQLFKEESTVIIPEFGALTKTSEKTGEIMFMPYLKFDDGKLAKYISETDGIEEQDAVNMIAKFVREISAELDKGGSYDIFGFGSFFKNAEGEIDFKAEVNEAIMDESLKSNVELGIQNDKLEEDNVRAESEKEKESESEDENQNENENEDQPSDKNEKTEEDLSVSSEEKSAVKEEKKKDKKKKDKKKNKKEKEEQESKDETEEKKSKKKADSAKDSKDLIAALLEDEDEITEEPTIEETIENTASETIESLSEEVKDTVEEVVSESIDPIIEEPAQKEEEEVKSEESNSEVQVEAQEKTEDSDESKKEVAPVLSKKEQKAADKEAKKQAKLDAKAAKKQAKIDAKAAKAKKKEPRQSLDKLGNQSQDIKQPQSEEKGLDQKGEVIETKAKKKKGLAFWLLILLLLAIVGGAIWAAMNFDEVKKHVPFLQEEKKDLGESKLEEMKDLMGDLEPEVEKTSMDSTSVDMNQAEQTPDESTAEELAPEPVVEEKPASIKAPVEAPSESYHVIVGAFGTDKAANDLIKELKSKGFNAVKAGKSSGLTTVSAGLSKNREDAVKLLEKVLPNYPGSWLKKN